MLTGLGNRRRPTLVH